MDATERARLRALCEAATPGPWATYEPAAGGLGIAHGDPRTHHGCIARIVAGSPADAALIAVARNALPALIDALGVTERERDGARAEAERLRAALAVSQETAHVIGIERDVLRHRLDRVIVATDHIPQHLGATWWGQRLRAALVPPATEVPDDRARGTGGAT